MHTGSFSGSVDSLDINGSFVCPECIICVLIPLYVSVLLRVRRLAGHQRTFRELRVIYTVHTNVSLLLRVRRLAGHGVLILGVIAKFLKVFQMKTSLLRITGVFSFGLYLFLIVWFNLVKDSLW